MKLELDLAGVPACLRLLGPLTIAAAASGRADLLRIFDELPAGPVAMDLDGVSEIDGAGVQLMLSATHALRARGREPVIAGCPDGVLVVAAALGAADDRRAFGATRSPVPEEVA